MGKNRKNNEFAGSKNQIVISNHHKHLRLLSLEWYFVLLYKLKKGTSINNPAASANLRFGGVCWF